MQRSFRLKNISSDELIYIDKPSMLIGRSPQCDINVDSGLLSRHHASILLVDDETVLIKDLESTNGTFVNSMRISRANRLCHGDVITIGDQKFLFIDPNHEQNDENQKDLLAGAPVVDLEDDVTSNRTMIQSSVFRSLGLDPSLYNLVDISTDEEGVGQSDISRFRSLDVHKVPAVMIIKTGRRKGDVIKLNLPAFSIKEWTVGRGQLCDVVLEDPTVSSQHARISWEKGVWKIEDSGSTNGIKINGHKIIQSRFQHDDVLSIGSIKLLFKVLNKF